MSTNEPLNDININQKLMTANEEMGKLAWEMNQATDEYLQAKLKTSSQYARYVLEVKAADHHLTTMEMKAKADLMTEHLRIEEVKCESTYKKLRIRMEMLQLQLEALKEVSFNMRQEARMTQ